MNFVLTAVLSLFAAVAGALSVNPTDAVSLLSLDAAPAVVGQVCSQSSSYTVDSVSLLESGVKMTSGTCGSTAATTRSLERRKTHFPLPDGRDAGDECDTPCHTVCFEGTTSPAPADCQVIFDALATGNKTFTLGESTFVLYTYLTCGTSFTNQITAAPQPQALSYCNDDWGAVGHYIAKTCRASAGFAGGKCVANFGSFTSVPDWYTQVYNT